MTIPTNKAGVQYDFTCENETKVGDFRKTVLENTNGDDSSFEIE